MIFITGPLFSGKTDYARTLCREEELCLDAGALAAGESDLTTLADRLAVRYKVIVVTEVGGGIVPTDPIQRAEREAVGRLSCLLAERADRVVRVFCGLPMILKGNSTEGEEPV